MAAQIQKKVTATERRALDKLLDEDFLILKADIRQMAIEAKVAATKTIDASSKARITRARKLEDKLRTAIRSVEDEGYQVVNPSARYNDNAKVTIRVVDANRDKAVKASHEVIDGERADALVLLHKKQHETRRAMLTASLSEEAVALLGTIPGAEQVMLEASAARLAKKQLTV